MDIQELKQIIDSDIPISVKENLIIDSLAKDETVVTTIVKVLSKERETNKELITDMNLELSRAHVYIDMRPELKPESKENFNKNFVMDKIAKFYVNYKSLISHCFNRFN